MAREVTWTESASDDLAEIAAHIAKDSEFYAATIVREVVSAARSLTVLSERGRMVREYRDPAIRQLLVRDYRLLYQTTDSSVYVLRILHGARMLPPRAQSA